MDKQELDLFLTESELMQVSASTHIMAPFRKDLKKYDFIQSTALKWKSHGSKLKTAGRVIIIHTPPTKSGKRVVFLTLEDEEGIFDLTVFEDVHSRLERVHGLFDGNGLPGRRRVRQLFGSDYERSGIAECGVHHRFPRTRPSSSIKL